MNAQELVKLASIDPEVRDALFALTKLAADDKTEFNEDPKKSEEAEAKTEDSKTPEQPEQELAAAPVVAAPIAPGQPAGGPAEEGAKAAQAFLAPAFEAAAQGDVSAQNTIAKAAGEVARGVATAAAESMGTGESAPVDPNAAAPVAVPVATPAAPMASPEQATADQVVPQQAAPGAPAAVPA